VLGDIGITLVSQKHPTAGGSYQFVQLVNEFSTVGYNDHYAVLDTNGPVLDTSEEFPDYAVPSEHTTIDGKNYIAMNDTPSEELSPPPMKWLAVFLSFQTFLMWKPDTPGASWVSLRVTSWGAQWLADWNGATNKWDLTQSDFTANPPSANTTSYPEWDANITQFEYVAH
jgi:hypothetical protein